MSNNYEEKSEGVQALGSFFNFLHLIPNSGYLNYQQLIPEDRVSEFFSDVFSLGIASATVVATGERFATSLSSWKQETEDCLAA